MCHIWDMHTTRHLAFALCPHLPLFSIASALEVLRHANRACGFEAYRWSLVTEDDQAVRDTTGLNLHPNTTMGDISSVDAVYVIAGFGAADLHSPRLSRWLARLAQQNVLLGGVSNGSYLLAKSGLLDGYQSTVHWEDFEQFVRDYPDVRARYQRYVIDRQRISCSGAASTLDLFLELVRREQGTDIAVQVTSQMLLRSDHPDAQPAVQHQQTMHYSPRLQRALSALEAAGDAPPNVTTLAKHLGMGRRTLLDLFQREMGLAPKQVLQMRRLSRAQSLVRFSELSLSSIAEAVGFCSQSHMTQLYKTHYTLTPAADRRTHREQVIKAS